MESEAQDQESEKDRLRRECGAWLKQCREAVPLTQNELAALAQFQFKTFVSQVENGKRRIPPEHYRDWARALRLDTREFVAELLFYYEPTTYEIIFGNRRPQGMVGR